MQHQCQQLLLTIWIELDERTKSEKIDSNWDVNRENRKRENYYKMNSTLGEK